MSEIKVSVVSYGRKFLYMRFIDPVTGKTVTKSTGETTKKLAERAAARWEAELREGRYKPASRVSWAEFRERYENEVLNSLAPKTMAKVSCTFNAVEELIGIDKLAKLDANQLSRFQKRLREERKLAEPTIKGHLAHLKASLRWAERVGLLAAVPTIEMPKRARTGKQMKGRAPTREEFERMLDKVGDIVGHDTKPTDDKPEGSDIETRYKRFLRGLWDGGLRLGEALDLSWDQPGHIRIDLTGQFPMLEIPGDKQKSGNDQLLPIAPLFAELLLETPETERTGLVFKLGRRDAETSPGLLYISKVVSRIGEAAKVVVNHDPNKYASAHDFRRAYGLYWADLVMPSVLQEMMRHESLDTTMRFYVGRDGQRAAKAIHEAYRKKTQDNAPKPSNVNTSGNTDTNSNEMDNIESTQHIEKQ